MQMVAVFLLFASILLSQNADVYIRIYPDQYPPGIHYLNPVKRSDALALQAVAWLKEAVAKEKLQEWLGEEQLFFVVSRLSETKPIRIEVIYRRFWRDTDQEFLARAQPCMFFFYVTVNNAEKDIMSGIQKVIKRTKGFPRTSP